MVRLARPDILGRKILAFESRWPRQCVPSVEAVTGGCVGHEIVDTGRRGKHALIRLDSGAQLMIHFRMSGRFAVAEPDAEPHKHARALWTLDDRRRLLLIDPRKWARIRYVTDPAEVDAGLGIEPLAEGFTTAVLGAQLSRTKRSVKAALLDQALIAGLGNIYTDEALFRARIHPETPANRVPRARLRDLHGAIQAVLVEGIENMGTSIDWIYPGGRMQDNLLIYGRTGEPCSVCGGKIEKTQVAQRGTHACPRCQLRS